MSLRYRNDILLGTVALVEARARWTDNLGTDLACWVTQAESGWAVEAVTKTRLVCNSMNIRT
jgi:hypothetical protein